MNSRQKKLAEERRVRKLYDRIPNIECKGLCHTTCGPIGIGEIEQRMVAKAGVSLPIIDMAELQHVEVTDCPALNEENRCAVYDDRPMICRLWGVTEGMPCVYGCKPERVLSDPESWELIGKAEGKPGAAETLGKSLGDPRFRRYHYFKRLVGTANDIRAAQRVHGPDVKLAADVLPGKTALVNLALSDPQA